MSEHFGDPKTVVCPACDGKGYTIDADKQPWECKVCHGTGKAVVKRPTHLPIGYLR